LREAVGQSAVGEESSAYCRLPTATSLPTRLRPGERQRGRLVDAPRDRPREAFGCECPDPRPGRASREFAPARAVEAAKHDVAVGGRMRRAKRQRKAGRRHGRDPRRARLVERGVGGDDGERGVDARVAFSAKTKASSVSAPSPRPPNSAAALVGRGPETRRGAARRLAGSVTAASAPTTKPFDETALAEPSPPLRSQVVAPTPRRRCRV